MLSVLSEPIPAYSIHGTDQYLILGVDGVDCLVIDQDGDLRTVAMFDLKTKWTYIRKHEVWVSTQMEIEDLKTEPAHEQEV